MWNQSTNEPMQMCIFTQSWKVYIIKPVEPPLLPRCFFFFYNFPSKRKSLPGSSNLPSTSSFSFIIPPLHGPKTDTLYELCMYIYTPNTDDRDRLLFFVSDGGQQRRRKTRSETKGQTTTGNNGKKVLRSEAPGPIAVVVFNMHTI